jgi:hypothetical protein
MPGSFLFTQNTAGQHGGASHVRPLLRAANHAIPTFDAAVQDAVANQLVTVDGATIRMAADVAFMMIGRKSELRAQVAAPNMTYIQIRSAAPNTDLSLYRMKYRHLSGQKDHIYVLAGPGYWNGNYGADLSQVNIQDNNQRSWALDLGPNPATARGDRSQIIDRINAVAN